MKNKVVPIVIIILLLIGGGWYFMSKAKTAVAPGTQTLTGNQPSTMSSLKALIAQGVSQSCTYNSDKSQGTIYMSGGKVRADINTTVGSVSEKAHMLMMNNTSYVWMDGKSTGFKMAYDPNATPVPGASPSTTQGGIDPNQSMNYNCGAWVTDASVFTVPAGVNFTTFSMPSAAPAGSSSGSSGSSSQCSYCNALSGTDKTQCLAALNCK